MSAQVRTLFSVLIVASATSNVGCKNRSGDSDAKASESGSSAPDSWAAERQQKQASLDAHLATFKKEAQYFAEVPMSVKGIPYILFKSFPVIFPEIWKDPDFLDLGLPKNPRSDAGLPIGLGLTKDPQNRLEFRAVRMVNKSCGSCHVGHVKTADDKTLLIYGAPNSAYDENAFNTRVLQTLNHPKFNYETFSSAFVSSESRSKILKNYIGGSLAFASDVAAIKVANLTSNLFAELKKSGQIGNSVFATVQRPGKSFDKADPTKPSLNYPHPGHVDSFGMGVARGLVARDTLEATVYADAILSTFPGMVDYHATFMQKGRGAANWDGSQDIPEVRPLITALSQVGDPALISYDVNLFALEFTRALPAPPYPFAVNAAAAARGKTHFDEYCVSCHYAGSKTIHPYPESGTSSNRSRVISAEIRKEIVTLYQSACDYIDGKPALEKYKLFCHEAETRDGSGTPTRLGRRLTAEELVRLPGTIPNGELPDSKRGYTADPLVGIWARAPYLHNGSVPTLYHLLVPGERPAKFVRGDLTYDQEKLGFRWKSGEATGTEFDTSLAGMANTGHDSKGDYWKNNPEQLADLLEYLKTL